MEETERKEVSFEIRNPLLLIFLAFAVVILVFELLLILNKPLAFGDDAWHAYIAKYIGTNLEFPKTINVFNIYYTYSPMLHLLLGAFYLTPFGEILLKAFIPILVFITGLAIFVTVSKLLSRRAALIAAILAITLPSFVTYSVLIYTDILMVLFFFLSVIFTIKAGIYGDRKYWFLATIFACLSFLSKTYGLLSFIFIAAVLIYKLIRKEVDAKNFFKLSAMLIGISLLLLGGWLTRNLVLFHTLECNLPLPIKTECTLNIIDPNAMEDFAGYATQAGSSAGIAQFGIKNYMNFSYGILWLLPFTAFAGLIYLFMRKEPINNLILILLVPFLFLVLVNFILGVGQTRVEDLARAFLFSNVIFCLIAACFIDSIAEAIKKYSKYLAFIIIIIVIVLSWVNFKNKLDIMSNVKEFSPMFFQACDFIKQNTAKDSVFLSLWGAPTAYNCERVSRWDSSYLGDIVLSQDLTTTLDGLKIQNISHIFIQKFAMSQTPYWSVIPVSFVQFLEDNPDHFEKIYENGPSFQECVNSGGCDGTIIYKITY